MLVFDKNNTLLYRLMEELASRHDKHEWSDSGPRAWTAALQNRLTAEERANPDVVTIHPHTTFEPIECVCVRVGGG